MPRSLFRSTADNDLPGVAGERPCQGRRQTLKLLSSLAVSASAASLVSGCSSFGAFASRPRVSLLLPLTGRAAGVGQTMASATQLALGGADPIIDLTIMDTQGSPERAAEAAANAVGRDSQLVLGPLFGNEVPSVLAALDSRIPLITFSNDVSLADQGAFVFGVTPAQSVSAILRYARDRGIRRFALVAESGELGRRAADAARREAPEIGLTLTGVTTLDGSVDRAALIERLKVDGKGRLPDAVLLPGGSDNLAPLASMLAGTGMQLLGTVQWSRQNLSGFAALNDGWFAAPDPRTFTTFADAYQASHSGEPGILAGLAYDAVVMTQKLTLDEDLQRSGITRRGGFSGVVGDYRFTREGRCERDMAILAVDSSGVRVVDKITA